MPEATGLAALLQKIMPGLTGKADAAFAPGGAFGPQQIDPALLAAAQGQPPPGADQGLLASTGGGMPPGQMTQAEAQQPGMASLMRHPMFMAGMGMLSGNQRGDAFGGGLQGLMQANQMGLDEESRLRDQALRNTLMQHFGIGSPQGPGDQNAATMLAQGQQGAPPATPADGGPMAGALQGAPPAPGPGQSGLPGAPQMSPVPGGDTRSQLLAMLLGQDAGNQYGGVNPFLLSMQ